MSDKSDMSGNKLQGDLIYLRPIKAGDAGKTYVRWMNDPEVAQFLESRFQKHTLKSIKDYVASMRKKRDEYLFAICLADGDRHVGNIKLGPVNKHHRFPHIGLLIGEKSHWGKGIATESIRLVTEFAFKRLKLHKVMAGCYASNIGSRRAFKNVGFIEEGIERLKWRSNGSFVNGIILGLVNPMEK